MHPASIVSPAPYPVQQSHPVPSSPERTFPQPQNSPLRVRHQLLKRWVSTVGTEPLQPIEDSLRVHKESPFPVDPRLNAKIALWAGDITTLDCDVVVNPTNESFTDTSAFARRLFQRAGRPLLEHVREQLRTCRTGDLRLSEGYGLPCRHILHTVGPKYKIKFHSAGL